MLGGQPIEPGHLVGGEQVRPGLLGQAQEAGQVAILGRRGLTGRHELLLGVGAHTLQQPVAHAVVARLGHQQRLIDQLGERIDRARRRSPGSPATASARASVKLPANTLSRWKQACSGRLSRP